MYSVFYKGKSAIEIYKDKREKREKLMMIRKGEGRGFLIIRSAWLLVLIGFKVGRRFKPLPYGLEILKNCFWPLLLEN